MFVSADASTKRQLVTKVANTHGPRVLKSWGKRPSGPIRWSRQC